MWSEQLGDARKADSGFSTSQSRAPKRHLHTHLKHAGNTGLDVPL